MKNILQKKGWGSDTNPAHVEPHVIQLIKEIYTGNSYEDDIKLKLRRDSTPGKSDLYEFKMSLFENGNLKETLWFVRNFDMTLEASGR